MTSIPRYYLVLDSNIWVAERMLYSALGSATLYALTKNGALIGLPEIVELEVSRVLIEQADNAAETIKRSSQLLRQISGHHMSIMAPSQEAIKEGIDRRWKDLSGLLKSLPFTLEQARSALLRIVQRTPPCGPNNEQFRDCCIWQCTLDLAVDCSVHLVTNDHAFHEGGNRSAGLSSVLSAEVKQLNREIHLHSSLNAFLASMDYSVATVDQASIRAATVTAITPRARELASGDSIGGSFELGTVRNAQITGYATPKASVVAISFSITFSMARIEIVEGSERQVKAKMRIDGECSYDPNSSLVSDIEISGWSKSLDSERGGFWGTHSHDPKSMKQYSEGNFRVL